MPSARLIGARRRERLVERRAEARDVAHLAAAARLAPCRTGAAWRAGARARSLQSRLARRVAAPSNQMSPSRFTITAGVCCARVAERQVGEHARLLLELRRHAGVDRVVAAVVRPRRDLVDEQRAVARHEHLDAQHAAVVERRGDAAWRCSRALARAPRRRAPARSTRRGCRRDGGSRRPARSRVSPRSLRATITEISQRERDAAARARTAARASRERRARRRSRVATRDLALAVVAEARALDDAGQQRGVDAARSRRSLRSTANGATAKPCPTRNVFSRMRSCAMATLAAAGRHARAFARGSRAPPRARSRTRSSPRGASAASSASAAASR